MFHSFVARMGTRREKACTNSRCNSQNYFKFSFESVVAFGRATVLANGYGSFLLDGGCYLLYMYNTCGRWGRPINLYRQPIRLSGLCATNRKHINPASIICHFFYVSFLFFGFIFCPCFSLDSLGELLSELAFELDCVADYYSSKNNNF